MLDENEGNMLMHKPTMLSRLCCNFYVGMCSWFERLPDPLKLREEDKTMEEKIDFETKFNKMIGLPPADRLCEKNPYRFM